jgi:hypothetical protein
MFEYSEFHSFILKKGNADFSKENSYRRKYITWTVICYGFLPYTDVVKAL